MLDHVPRRYRIPGVLDVSTGRPEVRAGLKIAAVLLAIPVVAFALFFAYVKYLFATGSFM